MKWSFPIVISITALVVAVLGTTPFGQAAVDGAKVAVAPAKVPLQAVGVIKRGPRGKRGLRGPRGGIPWWLEEAIRCRDHALRELASSFLMDQPTSQQVRWIRLASVRYAGTAWRHD